MIKSRFILKRIEPYINSPEAIIITGMRRTGKTTLLNIIYSGIPSENKIFLDLENPLNRKYFEEENYENIKRNLEILGLNLTAQSFVFCDEIQFVKSFPSVVKYFIDHYKVKFFLTGSASFYLKNLFAESLAGRKFIFELFPLSFGEFLVFKESKIKMPGSAEDITSSIFDTISVLYDEYLAFGGFPGVVLKTNSEEKKKAIEEIFTSFFQSEIIQLGDFRKNQAIRDLMLLLAQRAGTRLDIQKLSRELEISRQTINDYISFLEGTYFIKTIKPYTRGRDTEIRKAPKVYICDVGLLNHLARLDMGILFENASFQTLRLLGELNYYQKKSGAEIDFILERKKGYEVKLNPQGSDIRKTKDIAKELGLEEFKVISKHYSKLSDVVYGFML